MTTARVEHEAFAWAAMSPAWTTPSRYIDPKTVRRTRREVIAFVGSVWRPNSGYPVEHGWYLARQAGWSCVRVKITAVF